MVVPDGVMPNRPLRCMDCNFFEHPDRRHTMTRRTLIFTVMTLSSLMLAGGSLGAHDGHEHKVMGTVTMAAADHVMLKDTANKDVTVNITAATKVTRDKKTARVQDIQNGVRVAITAVTRTDNGVEKLDATLIELGPAPAR
jgi:hypothetical protein